MRRRIEKQLNINNKPFDCLKGGTIQNMNQKSDENKKPRTSQPTTGGCRMKQIRSLILFLLAGTFLIAGLPGSSLAAGDTTFTFSGGINETSARLMLNEVSTDILDSTYVDSVAYVTSQSTNKVACKFRIHNDSTAIDTLTSVVVTSFNDSILAGVLTRVALYKGTASPTNIIRADSTPGDFVLGDEITLSGFKDAVAANDSTIYWIVYTFADSLADSLHGHYAGAFILDSGLTLTLAHKCPENDDDTLRYYDDQTLDNSTGLEGEGRTLVMDLRAPKLDIAFDLTDDAANCVDNGIVNLGDSISVSITDTTVDGLYLPDVTVDLTLFGPEDSLKVDMVDASDGAGRLYNIRIPDEVFDGAGEYPSGFSAYYLVVTATDEVGNTTRDSIHLVDYAIDTKKPVFDDDTVLVELAYDANSDGIAAVGDSIRLHADLTTEGEFELDSVVANLSTWGLSGSIHLEDQGYNRKYTATVEILAGDIDSTALDSSLSFTITAYDNGCNNTVDSSLNPFDIDNQLPLGSVLYTTQKDVDANNIANINDSVKMTVTINDATKDLADTCPVMVDLQTSGLGGSAYQCIETKVADDYVYKHKIIYNPQFAQYAVEDAANTHHVIVTLTDDAGNTNEITSSNLPQPIDTKPPLAVALDNPSKGACAINLSWDGHVGDRYYRIFSDGGNGWAASDTNANNYVGTALYPATTWSTDEADTTKLSIEDGKTYQFVIKVIDNSGNKEYYTNFFNQVVSSAADCQAPTACVDTTKTKSGGSYGKFNGLDLIVTSTDADIDGVTIKVRDANAGSSVPGPWVTIGAMSQVGGGGVFTAHLDSANLDALGQSSGYLDDTYELITVATDRWGNTQTNSEALEACIYSSPFTFHWFWVDLPLRLVTVNDTVSPQDPDCGYNVTRTDSNKIVLDVDNFAAGDTFTVDVMAFSWGDDYRVFYKQGIVSMPYTVYLNATNFPKGNQHIFIGVTRNDGNMSIIGFDICVPDENAPEARITNPLDNEIVRRSCNSSNPLEVWAKRFYDSYDKDNTTRVEFYEALYADTIWSKFDVVVTPYHGRYYIANWSNCKYNDGDRVKLRAVYYDDHNNTFTTAYVTVIIDTLMPDISLTIPQAKTNACGDEKIGGLIDLTAKVNTVYEDVKQIDFYVASSEDPDLYDDSYSHIGTAEAATSDGIYIYHEYNTDNLTSDKYYRFRAIATDIAGNVMWDSNEDGVFDNNTFDPATKNSDKLYYVDNSETEGLIRNVIVRTDAGDTVHIFPTPFAQDRVYAAMGDNLTIESQTLPIGDTCDIASVVYYWDGTEIGVGSVQYPYAITFDPVALGFINPEEIADDYVDAELSVEFTDIFGNTNSDYIDVYILDITPNQALMTDPKNNACVSGEVNLEAMALNSYNIHHVTYKYRAVGSTDWIVIGSTSEADYYEMTWNTVNAGIADGQYQVAAVATDNSLNEDANPKYITLNVINTPPVAALTSPADSAYINYETTFKAEVTSGTATKVEFYYKEALGDNWHLFGTDNEAPWEATSDFEMNDGWYNVKARVYNCAEGYKDSEWRTFFLDGTNPYAKLTTIAGYDVEGNNDPTVDLTGQSVVEIAGMFRDDLSNTGYNSGIAKVAFYLTDDEGNVVRVKFIDPATAGSHSVKFDISGLSQGDYRFACRAWDNVGNWTTSGEVEVTISDVEVPVTAIAGYYPGRIYGYDWSGDADAVLFEYLSGTEWIGIGIGYSAGDNIWYADWSPAPGTYTLRMKATDTTGNYSESLTPLVASFTLNADGTFSFVGTGLGTLAAQKNYEKDNIKGVAGINSTLGEPVVIGIYKPLGGSFTYEVLALHANLDNADTYYGSFNANVLNGGGKAYFFASAPSGANIMLQQTTLSAYQIYPDLGTNGTVKGNNNTVSLTVYPGAATGGMVATILETWMPTKADEQDYLYHALGNNRGYANYIGCNSEGYCEFTEGQFATITMPYDSMTTIPPESLIVGWWDASDDWDISGIYHPVFNATTHTVTFQTQALYGIYAVLYHHLPVGPSPITIEFLPNSCGYYDPTPTICARVRDDYSGIDQEYWTAVVDGNPIIINGTAGDGYTYEYDDITGKLEIKWHGHGAEFGSPNCCPNTLSCGPHTLLLIAKNYQAQYDTASYQFTVDCKPPTVIFNNSYVGKNPTITFNVSDDLSGVNTSSIHVDVLSIQKSDTTAGNPYQYPDLFYLQTFFPHQITVAENGDVTIPTTFELNDERALVVAIYNGDRDGAEYVTGDPLTYHDWIAYYDDDDGIYDCVGNRQNPVIQILAVDYEAPAITILGVSDNPPLGYLPGICPVRIRIADDGSGVSASGVQIFEDNTLLTAVTSGQVDAAGKYNYNATTGIMEYCPTPGAIVMMVVTDRVGNQTTRMFNQANYNQITKATVNHSPWNPSKDAELKFDFYGVVGNKTIKIYDFGGDLVTTLNTSGVSMNWTGTTDDGDTQVANGVYFAHIVVDAQNNSYSTVVKFAIVRK